MRLPHIAAVAGCLFSGHVALNVFASSLFFRRRRTLEEDDLSHLASWREKTDEVLNFCNYALQSDCNVNADNVSVYFTDAFSTFSLGSPYRKNGAIIGLSKNYVLVGQARSPTDILRVTYCQEVIDWETEKGKRLKALLVPSEEELLFVLGHEAGHLLQQHFFYHSFLAPTFFALTSALNSLVKIPQRRVRIVAKVFIWYGGFVCYLLSRARLSQLQEYQADSFAVRLGLRYADGGIRGLQRKIAISAEDELPVSAWWRITRPIRQMHPPLQKRLECVKKVKDQTYQ